MRTFSAQWGVVGMWDMHIASFIKRNKINFETPLKDTISLVIINLKICDSAEKLNLLSLDQPIKNFQRQCSGNHVNVTRTGKTHSPLTLIF